MRISIPQPCHERWSEMTPNEKGAFCNVCSKTVVDFTSMADEEVKNYFIRNTGQKTCGRFKQEQLYAENTELKKVLALHIPIWKKIVAAIFILFGSLLTSCDSATMGKTAVQGDVINQIDSITKGEPVIAPDSLPLVEEIEIVTGITTVGTPIVIVEDIICGPSPDEINIKTPDTTVNIIADTITRKECDNTDTVTINY
ncbi:MAG TPA: hypothetical protein VF476_19355 [Chitinophagaceae bacterium]